MKAPYIATIKRRGFRSYRITGYRAGRLACRGYLCERFTTSLALNCELGRRLVPVRAPLDPRQHRTLERLVEDWKSAGGPVAEH